MSAPADPDPEFLDALNNRKLVLLRFYSNEDRRILTRKCAPMDYGPSRRARDHTSRYHFWDFTSDAHSHPLSLLPQQVKSLEVLDVTFEPSDFVTWKPKWIIPRDWGQYS